MAIGIIVITLLIMSTGRAPLYLTAVLGGVAALLADGVPLSGESVDTVSTILKGALHPLPVVDMLGVLLFIGIMKQSGCMDTILRALMRIGRHQGGAPGIAAAAAFTAALLGTLSAYTQPALTAAVAGPAAVRLGMQPKEAAGMISLANALSNACSFTHPTFVAVLAVTGVSFGLINVLGFFGVMWILIFAYFRVRRDLKRRGVTRQYNDDGTGVISRSAVWLAVLPFLILCGGIMADVPIFLAGIVAGLFVCLMKRMTLTHGESAMMSGISIPIMAALSLLFLASVMDRVGFTDAVVRLAKPFMMVAPIQILYIISALTGLLTQSSSASAAVVLPVTQAAIQMGCEPLDVTFAAVTGCAVMQLFMTGGAVTSLSLVVKVIPGTVQRDANLWQRPIILADAAVCFLMTFFI